MSNDKNIEKFLDKEKEIIEKEKEEKALIRDNISKKTFKNKKSIYFAYVLSLFILVVMILLTLQNLYFFKYVKFDFEPTPVFMPVNENNQLFEEIPLSEPVYTDAEREQFLVDFLFKYFSYSYINYEKHAEDIKYTFEEQVYNERVAPFFNSSFDIKTLVKLRAISEAVRVEPLELKTRGEISNRLAWRYSTKVRVITHTGEGKRLPETKNVTLVVIRANKEESENQLLITNWLVTNEE